LQAAKIRAHGLLKAKEISAAEHGRETRWCSWKIVESRENNNGPADFS